MLLDLAVRAGYRPGSRRSFLLLLTFTFIYVGVALWILLTGWVRIMATTPIRPEAVTLYVTLILLTVFPLAMRFLYSSFLIRQLERATQALGNARDSARSMARTKADFLATMSHEIRTPLNAVIGFSQLLGGVAETPRQREYTAAIRASSTHLLSIVNDVLDYSKIDAGRVELEERPVAVRPLVESCVQAVSLEASKRGLKVSYRIGPGTPATLFGDATRIRQVLLNLLSNAVKFTQSGRIRVVTRGERERSGRRRVSFEVHDTGIGISPEDQQRLFRAFTQVDPSATRSHGGTGLGLAISQRLCGLMGGDLTVQSRPGHGSTFTATIRAAAPHPTRIAPAPLALRGIRLLIVDDAVSRAVVARSALAWGMLIRATGDPEQALAWIRKGDPFDVAFLGDPGPGRRVEDLAKQLGSAGRAPLPLVRAFKGRQRPSPAAELFAAQVHKPISAGALLKALWKAVGIPHPPAEAARTPRDLRVLLVEDNALNEMLALRVLENLGYAADVARNGEEAVEAVVRQRYDVVLMDVQMPVMDGLEATRTIYRRVPRSKRPLIVGLSANAMPGDREQCLRAGMDDYTPKPMDQGRLASVLAAAGRRPVADAMGPAT
ncbi:MAG TPA: ATP-binding protein [Candidatus Thermoplasmatota archaeon]|nr:ATP-binding protein [Candidatus Thermoplasmatota archaeon]